MLNRIVRVQATASALSPERFDGAILFWEEAFTSTSTVWNDLHVLRQAGVLDRISGMVVGRPFEVETTQPGPESLRDIVVEVVGDRDIPVLGDVDIGHAGPNLPMPLGVRAEMDADARTLSLLGDRRDARRPVTDRQLPLGSDVREHRVQRARSLREIERVDEQGRVVDLAVRVPEEAPQLLLDGPPAPLRLLLEGPERPELTPLLHECPSPGRRRGRG